MKRFGFLFGVLLTVAAFFCMGTVYLTYIRGGWRIDECVLNTPDIDGGTIDDCTVGATTPSTRAFTTVAASTGFTGDITTDSITNVTNSHVFQITRTVEITIGHPGETTTDLAFTSAANTTEQTLDVNSLFTIPAWGRVLSVEVICTEDVNSSAGACNFSTDAGHSSGGAEWVASAVDVNTANAVATSAAAGAPYIAPSSSTRHVYINSTPGQNWSTIDAGEWVLFVTYIDLNVIKD